MDDEIINYISFNNKSQGAADEIKLLKLIHLGLIINDSLNRVLISQPEDVLMTLARKGATWRGVAEGYRKTKWLPQRNI